MCVRERFELKILQFQIFFGLFLSLPRAVAILSFLFFCQFPAVSSSWKLRIEVQLFACYDFVSPSSFTAFPFQFFLQSSDLFLASSAFFFPASILYKAVCLCQNVHQYAFLMSLICSVYCTYALNGLSIVCPECHFLCRDRTDF